MKSRTMPYQKVRPMSRFIYGGLSCIKIADSHAVDTATGKDVIPALYDRVKVIGRANAAIIG